MIGEQIQCPAAGARVLADQEPVLALIEKCARLLSRPRRGEVLQAVFGYLDHLGNLAAGQHNLLRQSLVSTHPCIVPQQNPLR